MTEAVLRKSHIPHWGQYLAATVLLGLAFVGVRFGVPMYRQQRMIEEFTNRGIQVSAIAEPQWLPLWPAIFSLSVQIICPDPTFNDEDLMRSVDLRALKLLEIMETQITDSGLQYLSRSENLQWLHIDETNITDAGLSALAELQNLKLVTVRRTRVTPEGVAKLRAALPGCEIIGP